MATGDKNIINQFNIANISRVPCDPDFLKLLPQRVTLKRPYDATEGVKNVNQYGEIIMTYPEAQVIETDLPVRLEPVRPRGDIGLKIEMQGGETFVNVRVYICGNVDVRENDSIFLGTREYQLLLPEEYYDFDKLHHYEVWARRVDNL